MRTKRAIVIGSGPAGAAAAMALAGSAGVECLLLERRPLPRTKVCGSGLSPWTLEYLDELGVGQAVRRRAYRIDGAMLAGTRGPGIELRGHHETAVLLREELDWLLTQTACARGARLRDGVTVRRVHAEREGDRLIGIETSDGALEADVIIDASGATGKLSQAGGKGPVLHTIMGWYEGVQGVSDVVELYFDETVKPHYGWVFPENASRVNIGMCFQAHSGPGARARFEAFLERRLRHRLRHASPVGKWVGHPVHTSATPARLAQPGVLVAGEAARLADAATAEGIFHALVSGHAAGTVAAHALRRRGRLGQRDRLAYTARVQRQLGARLLAGRALMGALRTPLLDGVLALSGSRAAQTALRRMFTGLYHG